MAKHDSSRRKFLKGVGIAGAGAAITDHLWTEAEAKEQQTEPNTMSGEAKVVLNVNGQQRTVQVEPRTTLLNAMRNHASPPSPDRSSFATWERAAPAQCCSTASPFTRVWFCSRRRQ